MPELNDQMVRRAQRGDKDAFVALMEEHKIALYRAARAILHNDEDAADAMQETVLEAWSGLAKLEAPRYCKTWLTRVLIYNCCDILRRKKRETPVEFLPEQAAEERGEEAMDVKRTLQGLSQNDRLVLTLFYLNDMPVKQIARTLDVSESAVRTRLVRSRARFREAYLRKENAV